MRVFPEEVIIWISRCQSREVLPSPVWVGISQLVDGPNRTKRWRKGKFFLSPWAESLVFWPWTLELLVLGSLDSASPAALLGLVSSVLKWELVSYFYHHLPWFSGSFRFRMNSITHSPVSPACRQQIVELLSLLNCVNQLLYLPL